MDTLLMYLLDVSITMHSSDGCSKFRYFITIFYLADRSVPQAAINNYLHIVEDGFFFSTNYITQKIEFPRNLISVSATYFPFKWRTYHLLQCWIIGLKFLPRPIENMQNHLLRLIFSHIKNENHFGHMFEPQSD